MGYGAGRVLALCQLFEPCCDFFVGYADSCQPVMLQPLPVLESFLFGRFFASGAK